MSEQVLLISDVGNYVAERLKNDYPTCAPYEKGEWAGWRTRFPIDSMMRALCRFDCCGRISKRDVETVNRALGKLQKLGKIGPIIMGHVSSR